MSISFLKRVAFQLVAYGLPAYLLTTFLQRLSGSALWIPSPWRVTIYVLVLGAGMACFQLARRHKAKLPRPELAAGTNPRMVPARMSILPGAAIVELAIEGPASAENGDGVRVGSVGEGRGQWLALAYWMVMFVLLIPQLFLRFHCVIPWNPDALSVHAEYGDPADLTSVPPPAQLEATQSGFKGSILLPPRFLLSEEFTSRVVARSIHYDKQGIQAFLDQEPIEFIESLRAESRALWITVVLILVIHLGILLAASTAYGYSFSVVEELAQHIPGFGAS